MSSSRAMTMTTLALAALAVGACGSSDDDSKPTSGDGALTVKITAPADDSTVGEDRVTVRGTVSSAEAEVQVLGEAAQVGNGVFTKSVALHRGENTIDVVASAPGSAPATATITVTRKGASTGDSDDEESTTGGTVAPPLTGTTDCGGGLTAGANTSCPFAENVRAAHEQTGSGVLDVYSPVTDRTYRMYCTADAPHVCTGGNNATVYFYDDDTSVTYDTRSCGDGVEAGPNTSCAFAVNVRDAFYDNGGVGGTISAYSPVNDQTYRMYCSEGSPHVCTGGNDAAVYFP